MVTKTMTTATAMHPIAIELPVPIVAEVGRSGPEV
jgi:hypothetical protein